MIPAMDRMQTELQAKEVKRQEEQERQKQEKIDQQRAMRQTQLQLMETRGVEEARRRQAQFRQGLSGAWDYLRGEHKRIQQQNEREAYTAMTRDRAQKDELVFRHLQERQHFKLQTLQIRDNFKAQAQELKQDAQHYTAMRQTAQQEKLAQLRSKQSQAPPTLKRAWPEAQTHETAQTPVKRFKNLRQAQQSNSDRLNGRNHNGPDIER
jgi:hypothetical protein